MHNERWENRKGSRSNVVRNDDSRNSMFERKGPRDRSLEWDRSRDQVDDRDQIDVPGIRPPPPPPPGVNGHNSIPDGSMGTGMFNNMMGMDSGIMMNMFVGPNMPIPPINSSYMLATGMIGPGTGPMGQDPTMMMNAPLNPTVKEIIHCKSCTLFPPNPNAPQPTTREKPAGCRTVFVGGLPDNVTESILAEVFERCGEISTLRLSKKNFCHIRFVFELSVDAALYLSGYRIRIGSNSDPPNTGRLHVDYAEARDDQYEWECRQRQLERERRHRERMEEERMRPPSPPPVIHYSDHEASSISEKIKNDDTFTKAIQTVVTWLERGDCNKRNVNNFYSMIQSTNAHVRKLFNEKSCAEEDMKKAKDLLKGRMQGILLQFSHIERLFVAACHKKVWDHFTKAQRKNIEAWKKSSMELKNIQFDDPQDRRVDDEMDVSDDDEPTKKRQRNDVSNEERNNLKDENDSLKCQVEAYKNEVEILKSDHKLELETKEKEFKIMQLTLQTCQQQLIDIKRKQQEEERAKSRLLRPTEIITLDDDHVDDNFDSASTTESALERNDTTQPKITDRDAKLIGVISAFLNVHPFGAGLDYIWSYVSKVEANLRPSEIEALMNRFPTVFKQELSGIGANIERKWIFTAFK